MGSLSRWVLVILALPFLGVGVAFMVAPETSAGLVGLSLADATAFADVRAVYGGLQLGCGGLLVAAAWRPDLARIGLVGAIALYGGLAFARCVSVVVSGVPSTVGLMLHAAELAGLAFALVAWFKSR